MDKNYYLAFINEFATSDEVHPVVYTRDLYSCMAVLTHEDKSTTLFHIEAYYAEDIKIDKLKKHLEESEGRIISADVLLSRHTDTTNTDIVVNLMKRYNIDYQINNAPVSLSNETAIGYNHKEKVYYGVTMHMGIPIFEEVTLGEERHI